MVGVAAPCRWWWGQTIAADTSAITSCTITAGSTGGDTHYKLFAFEGQGDTYIVPFMDNDTAS